jgi:coiled-coil domain-containing protein 6
LIGLASPDPYSQPTHMRSSSTYSNTSSSPSTSIMHLSTHMPHPTTHGVPIPRPPSQIHRPNISGIDNGQPLSQSPSSSESPFPFSPMTNHASLTSPNTNITSPPTSLSFNSTTAYGAPSRGLSYPSVPPPSLSSSFGSPTVSLHMHHRDTSLSPIEPLSRRNSNAWRGEWRNLNRSEETSRRGSVERGARVAETGTLVPRSRASSQNLAPTSEAPDSVEVKTQTALKRDT